MADHPACTAGGNPGLESCCSQARSERNDDYEKFYIAAIEAAHAGKL
jgi:hypothetical protein